MSEPSAPLEVDLKSLRDRPFELLAELERRGRVVSAQLSQEADAGREWVGVALRMAGDLYLVAREETREVLGVPASTTRVPGAKPWIKGLANVRGQLLPIIDLRQFLGSGITPITRNTRVLVVQHSEIPAGLLVDEVLAVGDLNFQKKCIGKMGDVARAGRTIMLVSHQMNQMRRLCNRVMWVDGGHVRMTGATHSSHTPTNSLSVIEHPTWFGRRGRAPQRGWAHRGWPPAHRGSHRASVPP